MFEHEYDLEKLMGSIVNKLSGLRYAEFELYISDVEKVEYKVDRMARYTSGKVYLFENEPTIYIDTEKGCIFGDWGIDKHSIRLDDHIIRLIDFFLYQNYNRAKKMSA